MCMDSSSCVCVCVCVCVCMLNSVRLFSLSMEFPRQEYQSGLPFPPSDNLPEPGIEPTSPALEGRFFTTESTGKPTIEYYLAIKRNKFETVVVKWMNLLPVIQSEISQKEKNKYCVLMHIYGIQKNSTDEPVYRKEMEMQMQRIDWSSQLGKEGQDKLRKQTDVYILSCVKQITSGKLIYNTGSPAWCCVTTLMGRVG